MMMMMMTCNTRWTRAISHSGQQNEVGDVCRWYELAIHAYSGRIFW